jgi:hypothetical protein
MSGFKDAVGWKYMAGLWNLPCGRAACFLEDGLKDWCMQLTYGDLDFPEDVRVLSMVVLVKHNRRLIGVLDRLRVDQFLWQGFCLLIWARCGAKSKDIKTDSESVEV